MAVTDTLTHEAALQFLMGRINFERTSRIPYRSSTFRLRRMYCLLDRLGNPQNQLNLIHVAGTKGKGSTATIIAAILKEAGYRTGLYTSPHLHRLEERASVDGEPCPPDQLVERVHELMPVVAAMDGEARFANSDGPTFFEVTTSLALLHFLRREVDVAVMEVGLGGRLDSTNVCRPLVSVITSISFDHTEILGNTLPEITREKAGIIKRKVPVVSGVASPDAQFVVEQVARQRGCTTIQLGRDFDFEYCPPRDLSANGQRTPPASHLGTFRFRSDRSFPACDNREFSLAPLGRHQAANAAVALAAIAQLTDRGWRIPEDAIRRGLSTVHCPARIEVVARRPFVVIDAAHNVASVEALMQTMEEAFAFTRRRTLIFATSKGKDAAGMLERLLPHFQKVIFTRYLKNPRFVDPRELRQIADRILRRRNGDGHASPQLTVCPDPRSSWRQAESSAGADDMICVAGSAFIAAEVREFFQPDAD